MSIQNGNRSYHSTSEIIEAVKNNTFPKKAKMTFHPQRWTDKPVSWVKELVWQNVKNVGKKCLIEMSGKRRAVRDE